MNRALLLPCDTRPPTLDLPHDLARVAGVHLETPPLEILNRLNAPGDTAAITAWLRANAASADAIVVTLETLTLGGMIPARRESDPLDAALARLDVLRELKREHPGTRILAYGVIVRVAHDNDPLEEKPYYAEYGPALRRVSEWTDRVERGAERSALDAARAEVPAAILDDWLGTRERNHAVHRRALEMLADGTLEHLCLTLDDTTPYGLAARDRRRLEALAEKLGVWDRCDIYPGADEVAATLLARAVVNESGRRPRAFVRYPSELAPTSVMLYEDRPLAELVKAHLRAAGCDPVTRAEDADLVLAVNAPTTRQAHRAPDLEVVDTAARNLWAFMDAIRSDVQAGRAVTVADVAYANGAEPRFTELLLRAVDVTRLAGYAAWNTAGNTLGSAVAAGVTAVHGRDPVARAAATFARLVDDYLYQGIVRGEVRELMNNPSPFDLGPRRAEAEALIAARLTPRARALWDEHFAARLPDTRLELGTPSLAWPRLFTVNAPARVDRRA